LASVDQPFSPESDQTNNQSAANSSVGQAPQLTSGGGQAMGVGGGTGGTGAQSGTGGGFQGLGAANPTTSGAYPNLQKYMQANQNWNQSQGGLGGEIASNLNQQGNQVQQATQNAQNAFQNQGNTWAQNTQQAGQAFGQGLSDPYGFVQGGSSTNSFQPGGGSGGVPTAGGTTQGQQNAPSAQQNLQEASQALNASYQGPQNLFSANPNLQQQTQNYQNTAGQTSTEAGRYNLLQQMFGGNNYTQGQQSLDQALLQTNPQQMQALQGAQQQANQTQQNLQNANNQAQQQAAGWQQTGQQVQQQAQANLNAAVNSLAGNGGTIANDAITAAQNQSAASTAAQQALANGTLTQAQAAQLGLSSIANTYGANSQLGQFMQNPILTAQNSLSAADAQQVAALAQLGGLSPTALQPQSAADLQQYGGASATAGQYANPNSQLGYNVAGAQGVINSDKQNYENAVLQALGGSNGLWGGITGNSTAGTINFGAQTSRPSNAMGQWHDINASAGLGTNGLYNTQQLVNDLSNAGGAGIVGYNPQYYMNAINQLNTQYGGGLNIAGVNPTPMGDIGLGSQKLPGT